MRPSEVIVPSGMIRGGGVIATTALCLSQEAGITGMRVGGIRPGATLQMRSYAYDGPIYGYNGLAPDQVIANVQATLQQKGYYQGEVDGMLGPVDSRSLSQLPTPSRALCNFGDRSSDSRIVRNDINDGVPPRRPANQIFLADRNGRKLARDRSEAISSRRTGDFNNRLRASR